MSTLSMIIAMSLSLSALMVQAADPPAPPDPVARSQEINLQNRLQTTRAAAERGSQEAQIQLGMLYGLGEGVPQDYSMAYVWFDLAAAQGNQTAQFNRDAVAALMSDAQRQQAQALAKEYHAKYVAPFQKAAQPKEKAKDEQGKK